MQSVIEMLYQRLRFLAFGRNLLSKLFVSDNSLIQADILHVRHRIKSLSKAITLSGPAVFECAAGIKCEYGYRDSYAHNAKDAYLLKNLECNSITGLAYLVDDKVIATEAILNRKRPIGFVRLPLRKSQLVEGISYLANERNFYHFITEDLANILLLLRNNVPKLRIVLPGDVTWKAQLIKQFIDEDRFELVRVPKYCVVRQEYAFLVTKEPFDSYIHPFSIEVLRSNYVSRKDEGQPSKKLFISRRRAPSRDIKNSIEVEAFFEDLGFMVVCCEELTVASQIELFTNAHIVAGAHGAGFTNMLWAGENCRIIEIFEKGHMNFCYMSMASKLGFSYEYLTLKDDGSLSLEDIKI
ncbi:glycosyltransferase family 61 protein [Alteromonas hispanica]|uniref:DUF563 domain-containing protein n=1 Tax=Alteromonas hispanica TaxID=315421 RepID=A0A6L9MYB9_9ALTE|nr:glycosyltransferase 61 family protein [Alteromonas hispanica]NDW23204.1 DUF563 domain-containing protein [Alteromonas hispanica]